MGEKVSGPRDPLNPTQTRDHVDLPKTITGMDQWETAIANLTMRTHQSFNAWLPSNTFVRLKDGEQNHVYTFLVNRAYAFNNVIFDENGAYRPQLNTLSVYEGLVGDFPNLLIELNMADAQSFLSELTQVKDQQSWNAWKTKYGAMRNRTGFWQSYDWFNNWNFKNNPIAGGYFDLTYYDFLDQRF